MFKMVTLFFWCLKLLLTLRNYNVHCAKKPFKTRDTSCYKKYISTCQKQQQKLYESTMEETPFYAKKKKKKKKEVLDNCLERKKAKNTFTCQNLEHFCFETNLFSFKKTPLTETLQFNFKTRRHFQIKKYRWAEMLTILGKCCFQKVTRILHFKRQRIQGNNRTDKDEGR